MKTTHLVASELCLVLLMAGCAATPMDQACRVNLEKETKVLAANGHRLKYHRAPNFTLYLSAAEDSELNGNYGTCLRILEIAQVNRHTYYASRFSSGFGTGQNQSYSGGNYRNSGNNGGGSVDAAHHAAGHTHHHGH